MEHVNINSMRFALSQENRIVHIDEVPNGNKCACVCPACRGTLIAKNSGTVRIHHFAHGTTIEGMSCSETALHRAAKQLIADHKSIRLPPPELWPNPTEQSHLTFISVEVEKRIVNPADNTWIVADCAGTHDTGELLIEVAVNHRIDEDKLNKIRSLDIPTMEIVIDDYINTPWTWENLSEAVLNDSQRRSWAYLPEWFSATGILKADNSTNESIITLNNRAEWVFPIGNIWVFVRDLPFGNFKVYHRPSQYVRSIVEPICRGRGYWEPRFNCWIVFDKFRQTVLTQLSNLNLS